MDTIKLFNDFHCSIEEVLYMYVAVEHLYPGTNAFWLCNTIFVHLTKTFSTCLLQSDSSPLHLAAENGQSEVATLLITHGASVGIKDRVSNFKLIHHCVSKLY